MMKNLKFLLKKSNALSLYFFLLFEADENGKVNTTLSELQQELDMSKQEVRTAIKNLCLTHLLTHYVTHLGRNGNLEFIVDVELLNDWVNTLTNTFSNTFKEKEKKKQKENKEIKEKDIYKYISKKKAESVKKFVPPKVEEVKAYCQERNNSVNAENFVDFYTAKNWMIGKNKMKDWKASVRTWERKDKEKQNSQTKNKKTEIMRHNYDFKELERRKYKYLKG